MDQDMDLEERFKRLAPPEYQAHTLDDLSYSSRAAQLLEEHFWENAAKRHLQDSRPLDTQTLHDHWDPEPPLIPPRATNDTPFSFLDLYPQGSATLTHNDANGNLVSIHGLNLDVIEERSPIIAAAFEHSHRHSQLHLDLLSPLAALPFIRFLYTGECGDGEAYNDVPTSLLLHCQLYFFGSVFGIPELRSQALLNVIRQCEFACSSPDKPIDLCAAIRFCYDHVDDNRRVVDEVIEYCIQRFADHKLGQDQYFKSLAFEHRPFYSDLAKACRRRGFEDEAAIDIIRLPYDPQVPESYASILDVSNPRFANVVHHLGEADAGEEQEQSSIEGKTTAVRQLPTTPCTTSTLTLALRAARVIPDLATSNASAESEQASSSEDEGFQIVRPVSERDTSSSGFVVVHRPAESRMSDLQGEDDYSLSNISLAGLRALAVTSRRDMHANDDAASSDSDWTLA